MVDRRRVEEIFRNLDGYLAQLRTLQRCSQSELTEDPIRLGATKYYLQVAVESCIDVANRLIARQGWRKPNSFADVFAVLGEAGLLEQTFARTLMRMAQFRNRLVHLYWDVDGPTIYQILQENLGDLEHFEAIVLGYLTDQARPGWNTL